ncbi:nucleotidyltransferase domain-containing protein [Alkaliphilus metalliredigens]|uniref:nucleotidyltransferase domain-containing protein n=1 Tax=Alkaliphilus metalliredigens TaxID=208226 RepID=UPI0002E7F663|nr:nucleotidyltransferase domain-containing protein [Alkaliphilus metalliredigens]
MIIDQRKHIDALRSIRKQLVKKYDPDKIILFGSLAKGVIHKDSDLDLCVIIKTNHKRSLLQDMYVNIESDISFDIVLYTKEEWEENIKDPTSFAYKILDEGEFLYGGEQEVYGLVGKIFK